ncbi:MAG: D-alanine--D-alanine ligase [Candidatus Hydrogenedentota bacterium]
MLVIKGGLSREREVSLRSGTAIASGLREAGFEVLELDLKEDIIKEILDAVTKFKPDVAFIALHGRIGEDGKPQAIFECLGIPYAGAGVLGSAIGLNKLITKEIFVANDIPTPEYVVYRERDDIFDYQDLEYPVIVKPWEEGSSIGMGIAYNFIELQEIVKDSIKYDNVLIIEKYYKGRELTVGVIGNREPLLLPIIEIVPLKDFFNYEAKYTKGFTEYKVPAVIDKDVEREIYFYSKKIYEILECRGMGRIDLILTDNKKPLFLEINTIPGFTETSLLPKAALKAGISFKDLVSRIVEYALEENKARK